jgi:hypothetical protein
LTFAEAEHINLFFQVHMKLLSKADPRLFHKEVPTNFKKLKLHRIYSKVIIKLNYTSIAKKIF